MTGKNPNNWKRIWVVWVFWPYSVIFRMEIAVSLAFTFDAFAVFYDTVV